MSSRKDQKEKLRQERLEREAAEAQSAARRRRMGLIVAGLLSAAVVVALVVVVAAGGGDDEGGGSKASASADWPEGTIPDRKITDLDEAVKAAGCVLENPKSEGGGHVTDEVKYKTAPATSGSHDPVPSKDRAYTKSPRIEAHVHSLEHGRVIYWFKPNAPAPVRGALKALWDEEPELVILSPYPRPMPYQVAASAWTRMLGCKTYNDKVPDALRAFRDAYRLKGPEYFPNANL
jgi:hypothetical protein